MGLNYNIHKAEGNVSYIVGTFDTLEEAKEYLTDRIYIDAVEQGTEYELNHEPSYNALLELISSYYSIWSYDE